MMLQHIPGNWYKKEAMFEDNSAAEAIKGVLQLKSNFTKEALVVVLFHDHGSRGR
nr:hypothetical protein [Pareuzebyella sediminis]